MNSSELKGITEEVKNSLLLMARTGLKGFDCSEKSLEIIGNWGKNKTVSKTTDNSFLPSAGALQPDRIITERPSQNQMRTAEVNDSLPMIETLETIRAEMGNCRRCNLGERKNNLVFGAGSTNARLVFVGEAPGHDEDMQGQPFVGASGQLLTKMIQAMGLGRDDVYICNILKCRPTGNRNPLPEEIIGCMPFLKRQLEVIKPEIICTLGGFATQALLEKPDGITRLRGRFHHYYGVKLMPVFHPAYLLRNESKKREAWEDLQKVMAVLGLKRQI